MSAATVRAWQEATAAGAGGFTMRFVAEVVDVYGGKAADRVPISECSWAWDGSSTQPVSGSLVVPAIDWSDPLLPLDWRPQHMRSALTPFGNRLRVSAGVDGLDGHTIWVPLGVGLIQAVEYERPAEVLKVTVTDLSTEIAQALTVIDFSTLANQTLGQFIAAVLAGAQLPATPTVVDPAGVLSRLVPAGKTWGPGTSLWEVLQDGVQWVDPSCRAWFDRDGSLRVDRLTVDTARPPTEVLAGLPEFVLSTGDGGHVTDMQTVLTREGAVNVVAVAVEDSEVVDPEYDDADDDPEDDGRGTKRQRFEDVGGIVTGAARVTKPSGRAAGYTGKAPTPPRWPFASVSSHPMGAPFGAKGAIWFNGTHYGTDFSAPSGGTVVAVCQGRIVQIGGADAGWAGPHYVVQQASDGSRFLYCHLASAAVKVGDFLLRGDTIGQAGAEGKATGVHLHLERRKAPYTSVFNAVDWRAGGPVK